MQETDMIEQNSLSKPRNNMEWNEFAIKENCIDYLGPLRFGHVFDNHFEWKINFIYFLELSHKKLSLEIKNNDFITEKEMIQHKEGKKLFRCREIKIKY